MSWSKYIIEGKEKNDNINFIDIFVLLKYINNEMLGIG